MSTLGQAASARTFGNHCLDARVADQVQAFEAEDIAEAEAQEADDAEQSKLAPKRGPSDPTPEEEEEHCAHHAQYRSWCRACVAGRGKTRAHKQLEAEREHLLPTWHIDYMFLGTGSVKESIGAAQYSKR